MFKLLQVINNAALLLLTLNLLHNTFFKTVVQFKVSGGSSVLDGSSQDFKRILNFSISWRLYLLSFTIFLYTIVSQSSSSVVLLAFNTFAQISGVGKLHTLFPKMHTQVI
jgi:hypothetical protein